MKKLYTTIMMAALVLTATAQVTQSELAGKYHLQGKYNFWEAGQDEKVYAHDDFTFQLEAQADGTFRLYSFFYNGMNEQFERLGYGATAEYSPSEQLLYVYQTPWLWDEYMGQFMESYGYGQASGPMMYFLAQKDPKTGAVRLSSTENSLGFYYHTYSNGQSSFVYAIDYPGVVTATQLPAYKTVTRATLPGDYTLSYTDTNGRPATSQFSIRQSAGGFETIGLLGCTTALPVYFEADGCGIYIPLYRPESGGYYTAYFGSNVGDCRVAFSFAADGSLVSDNAFSYSPDFRNWADAFDAVAAKAGSEAAVATVVADAPQATAATYDLAGRRTHEAATRHIVVSGGRKVLR